MHGSDGRSTGWPPVHLGVRERETAADERMAEAEKVKAEYEGLMRDIRAISSGR